MNQRKHISFSKHSIIQMIARGISRAELLRKFAKAKLSLVCSNQREIYTYHDLEFVLNPKRNLIITVYRITGMNQALEVPTLSWAFEKAA